MRWSIVACRSLLLHVVIRQEVAGDLLVDETIQSFVGVERRNHIVPVTPRIMDQNISLDISEVSIEVHDVLLQKDTP